MTDVGPPVLGDCPHCGEPVTEPWLLIEYERENGDSGRYAECPVCGDVVRPR